MAELGRFSPEVAVKPMFVVGTKLDAAQDPERRASLERLAAEQNLRFFVISSVTGEGLAALTRTMGETLLPPVGSSKKGGLSAPGHPLAGRALRPRHGRSETPAAA